jgi:uncharacterized protein (UPF0332 family)
MGIKGLLRKLETIRRCNKLFMTGKFTVCKSYKAVYLIMLFQSSALLPMKNADSKKYAVLFAFFTGKRVSCPFK